VPFFNLDEEDLQPYNDLYSRMGYETTNFLLLIGTNLVIIFVGILLHIIERMLQCCDRWQKCLQKRIKLRNFLYYGFWSRLIMETYLEMCICAILDLWSTNMQSWAEVVSSLSAGASFFVLIATIFFL